MEYSRNNKQDSRPNTQKSMNSRLFDREMDINFQHKYMNPINRMQIEREEFLKNSGDDEFDKRMPMRPEFSINKPIHENTSRKFNREISSYNPYNDYADVNSDTKLTDSIQNNRQCINGINSYGFFLFDNMLNVMDSAFIFSPYLIYSIFASLFIASDGNTEIELKNYFSYPRADILSQGLRDINIDADRLKTFGNCIIFPDEIDYNPQFCKNINMLTKIRKINKNNYNKETDEINNIIKNLSNLSKKSISTESMRNTSITLLNYGYLNPTWKSYFSECIRRNGIDFMIAHNQVFGYFEQAGTQVLELASVDGICFGIIYGDMEFNDKTYDMIIGNLKSTILEEVQIPKLSLITKLRYTNLLKETDLKTVFLDLKCPYLFQSECEITDCLQNLEFHVTEKSIKSDKINSIRTTRKFIVDKSFRFYVRLTNNTIILLGSY